MKALFLIIIFLVVILVKAPLFFLAIAGCALIAYLLKSASKDSSVNAE